MDIRQQIKSLLKALLDWSVVNKYFSIVGWDRFRWSRFEVSGQKAVPNFFFFCKTHRKTLVREYLFRKFAGLQPKRDSSTGVFLWILRNFQEPLLWKTSMNGFRIFSAVKSAYGGEIFCGDMFWSTLFMLGNYNRVVFRTLSNI